MNLNLKHRSFSWLRPAAMFAVLGISAAARAADPKIALSPSMVNNEIAMGDAAQLVDEQTLAGDPANGSGGVPVTSWTVPNGRGNWYYPASAFIDLGATYNITSVSLRDVNNIGDVTISKGTPFNWTPVFTQSLSQYNAWRVTPTTNFQSRYVRITLASAASLTSEIVLNGTFVSAGSAPPAATGTHVLPTMDEFIGANAFNDDPIDKLKAVGFVREYHNWTWTENPALSYPNNPKSFNPAISGGFRFDEFYLNARNAGLTVSPAIKESALSLIGGDANKLSNKPIVVGTDSTLPASYAMHADHMFQFAARYGNVGVADALLKIADGQPRTSGNKLLGYYENGNEPDKWWAGSDGYFSPYDLAAMCSADYDGHRGAMGATFGIKNADPSAKLVMAGLADPSVAYLKAMKTWSDFNRGGSFPADVINVHTYSNDSGGQFSSATGISPEADNLKARMAALVQWRDANVPAAELWVSEFGYDVNPGSVQRAPAIGATSAEEVQGQWLVRSYFALAAAGVDRAQMYMFRDVDAASTTKYNSSGLVTKKGEWAPRSAWYYVSTIKNRLKGMRFKQVVNSGNANVAIYKFSAASGADSAYAVWCPTSNNSTVANYQLSVPYNSTGLKLVTLTNGNALGAETPLTMINGKVTFNVSERPVLIVAANPIWRATTVKITNPADGARFGTADTFNVDAAVDSGSSTYPITQVDFFRDGVFVGTDTTAPYSLPQSGLAVGAYKYKARSKESTGALFTSPEITISVSGGTGLKGQYFDGSAFNMLIKTQTDPTINFDWGYNSSSGPGNSINHDAFSVRWTGKVQTIEAGTYGFYGRYDDGMRVWVNDGTTDRLVIDRWNTGASTYYMYGGTIALQAGQKYDIKVEYVQRTNGGTSGNGAQVKLYWQRPSQTLSDFIPQAQLYPAP